MNDIIPLNFIEPEKYTESISAINTYKNAGMTAKVNVLKYNLLKDIAKLNKIKLFKGDIGGCIYDTNLKSCYVREYTGEVPVDILKKMGKIKDSKNLGIMYNKVDPILVYDTKLRDKYFHNILIVLDKWK